METSTNLECTICCNLMHNATSIYPCLHTFCAGCICRWYIEQPSCPVCRVPCLDLVENREKREEIKQLIRKNPELDMVQSAKIQLDNFEKEYLVKYLSQWNLDDLRIHHYHMTQAIRNAKVNRLNQILVQQNQQRWTEPAPRRANFAHSRRTVALDDRRRSAPLNRQDRSTTSVGSRLVAQAALTASRAAGRAGPPSPLVTAPAGPAAVPRRRTNTSVGSRLLAQAAAAPPRPAPRLQGPTAGAAP